MTSLEGQTVSHYKVLELLGGGGMGVVYKARDLRLDRTVALKFLPPDLTRDPLAKERFIREARTASSFDHRNICTIYEIGETDRSGSFIAMPCYEGETLREMIERAPLTPQEATQIALQIAEGLSEAHEKGIIHRDIKPANIIVTPEGVAKILDFGLAKLRGQSLVTKSGSTVGTVSYMSPEQAKGEPADERTDIWSVGVLLYEMLSGRRPFDGDYDQVVFYAIVNTDPTPIADLRDDVPAELQAIVSRCLQKDPASRYRSMAEVRQELLGITRGAEHLPFRDSARALWRAVSLSGRRRNRFLASLVILGVVLLLALPLRHPALKLLGFASAPPEKHVAIIADTRNSTNAAFCLGMADLLTEWVARHRSDETPLSVIPSNELQKDGVTTASEARKYFGATLVITVRSQQVGDRHRLVINLTDARSLSMLTSEEVFASAADIPSLEGKAATTVARILGMQAPSDAGAHPGGTRVSSQAYDYFLQGRGYLQRYDREENVELAIDAFRKALGVDTAFALARSGLAEAYWRRYELDKDRTWAVLAGSESARALASGESFSAIYVTAGLISAGTGDYSNALVSFRRAMELDPDNAAAAVGLASAYEGLNDPVRAEEQYARAIELQPGSWIAYNRIGAFYARQARYEAAIEPFIKVTQLTPNHARGYSNLGAIYLYLGRYPEAEKALAHSIDIEPTYESLSNLGTLYYKQRQYGKAGQKFGAALALNSRDFRAWGNLASACLEIPGMRDTAIAAYTRAIEKANEELTVNPRDPQVLGSLAGYYSDVGLHEKARATVTKALAIAPTDGEILFRAGCVFEAEGNRTRALEFLSQALENGYPYKEIEDYPGLQALRKDSKFQELKPRR
jgi:serine/threonine-protein kinase